MELKRVVNRYLIGIITVCCIFTWIMYAREQVKSRWVETNTITLSGSGTLRDYEYSYARISEYYNEMLEYYNNALLTMSEENARRDFALEYKFVLSGNGRDTSAVFARDELFDNMEYAEAFKENVNANIEQSEKLIKTGFFKPGSTAYMNILKTRYDLMKIRDIEVGVDNGRAMKSILEENISHFMLLVIIIAVVYSFLSERKKGLWELVHIAPAGRAVLAVKRAFILGLISLVSCIIMYLGMAIIAFSIHGGVGGLNSLIQNDPDFMISEFCVTRLQYLLMYVGFSALSMWMAGMFVWAVLSAVSNQSFAAVIVAVIGVTEYLLYRNINYKSRYNILKHFNIFKAILPSEIFMKYRNWGFGGGIWSHFTTTLLLMLILLVIFFVVAVTFNVFLRPVRKKSYLTKMFEKIAAQISRLIAKLPMVFKELYKNLIIQKGVVIIALALLFVVNNRIKYGEIISEKDSIENEFYAQAENMTYGDELVAIKDDWVAQTEEVRQKMIEMQMEGKGDTSEYKALAREHSRLSTISKCAEKNVESLEKLSEKGIEARIIKPFKYRDIFGYRIRNNQQMIDLITAFVVIMLCFSIYSFETRQSTVNIIKSSKNGRSRFYLLKLATVSVQVLLVWAIFYGYNLYNIFKVYEPEHLSYPIQSLLFMKDFPIKISIGGYIAMLGFIKLLMLWCIALMVYFVSAHMSYLNSFIVSLALLAPHIVYIIGVKIFGNLSIVRPLGFAYQYETTGATFKTFLPMIVMIVLSLVSSVFTYKKVTK